MEALALNLSSYRPANEDDFGQPIQGTAWLIDGYGIPFPVANIKVYGGRRFWPHLPPNKKHEDLTVMRGSKAAIRARYGGECQSQIGWTERVICRLLKKHIPDEVVLPGDHLFNGHPGRERIMRIVGAVCRKHGSAPITRKAIEERFVFTGRRAYVMGEYVWLDEEQAKVMRCIRRHIAQIGSVHRCLVQIGAKNVIQ